MKIDQINFTSIASVIIPYASGVFCLHMSQQRHLNQNSWNAQSSSWSLVLCQNGIDIRITIVMIHANLFLIVLVVLEFEN